MGQANSRGRPQQSTATPSTSQSQPNDNDPERPNSKPELPPTTTTSTRSRRSAVRTSILNLVKRRSSIVHNNPDIVRSHAGDDDVSSPSTAPSISRRRWRSSRRWSTAPARNAINQSASEAEPVPSESASTSVSGNGKAREHIDEMATDDSAGSEQTPADRPSTPFPSSSSTTTIAISDTDGPSLSSDTITADNNGVMLSREEQEVSQNLGSWLGNHGRTSRPESRNVGHVQGEQNGDEEGAEEEVVIRPDNFDTEPTATPIPIPSVDTSVPRTEAPSTQLNSPPARQFPPPGTLVVVQGVVHTTDVARPPASDNSPSRPLSTGTQPTPTLRTPMGRSGASPATSGIGPSNYLRASPSPSSRPSSLVAGDRVTTRNRLSALIPRSRPASMVSVAPVEEASASDGTASDLSPESDNANSLGASTPASSVGSEVRPSENDGRPGGGSGIGNGNGNTNDAGAISSSSIDVLGTLLSVAAAATAASLLTGSSEPIFTSGLAPPGTPRGTNPNASPYASRPMSPTPTAGLGLGFGLADVDPDLPEPAGRGRDRMRHAWGNLRERLGLPSSRPSNTMPISPDTGRPMDAREVMLAEMARAFNLGLGLGNTPTNATSVGEGARVGEAAGEGNGEGSGEGAGGTLPPEDSFERFLIDLQADLRVALSQPAGDGDQERNDTGQNQAANAEPSIPASTTSTAAPSSPIPVGGTSVNVQVTPSGDDAVPPSTRPDDGHGLNIDNEDERVAGASNDVPPLLPSSPTEPPPPPHYTPSAPASTPSSSSRTERRPGGGINWWRLYRFPPITAPPQSQGLSATANSPRPASFPFTSTTPAAGLAPLNPDPPSGASTSAAVPANLTVIPVIVVGLQSVNMHRGQRMGDNDPFPGDDADVNGGGLADDVDLNGFGNPLDHEATHGAQRERRWHSRAADAIRNLRPGRRGQSRETQPGDAAGSRTFLIYVIGGYYPPDHHIVTGANTLDSFEALWELAELLGQVKPPTATKEDIDKSGLEIIKPAQLPLFEKAGKVSANCVERCLICLDDYEPEDDVRVLTCRHAFHKSCVDKWLQTGRNNCPACRSRGVSTDGPTSPMQASAQM